MDLKELQQSGHSVTDRAWITNPARTAAFLAVRPYFARLISEIERAEAADQREFREGLHQLDAARHELGEALRQLEGDRHTLQNALLQLDTDRQSIHEQAIQTIATVRDEIKRLALSNDGMQKDRMAINHRFASMEEQVSKHQIGAAMLADIMRRLEEVERQSIRATDQANQSFSALRPNQPTAILGTSLVLHDGPYGKFLLRHPDLISDHILAGGFWDNELKPVIERVGAKGGTAIDAGAYLGFHSVYMSRYFDTVYSFEPQVEIYRMLCTNLLINNCRHVTAINGALYERPGYMRLAGQDAQEVPMPTRDDEGVDYDTIGNAAAMVFQPAGATDADAVAAHTVDGLELKDLAFMKVDTQGSDLRVLMGARETIARCRPTIVAEYERELSRNHAWGWGELVAFFDEMNYSVEVLRDQGQGKQVDILARPK